MNRKENKIFHGSRPMEKSNWDGKAAHGSEPVSIDVNREVRPVVHALVTQRLHTPRLGLSKKHMMPLLELLIKLMGLMFVMLTGAGRAVVCDAIQAVLRRGAAAIFVRSELMWSEEVGVDDSDCANGRGRSS